MTIVDPKLILEQWNNGAAASVTVTDDGTLLLRRWTMTELVNEPDDFAWLVKRLLADPTYGQIAGEMKTLKSYILGFLCAGVASGLPIFDTFTPPKARPVVVYVGEGGRRLWTRRMRRICSAMGTTIEDLDVHPVFDVAPIASDTFQDTLRRDLADIEPGLVGLDPYYTYHGTTTKASDVHQEGALLNQLSTPCMDTDACLMVVNHMNQTGQGMSLKRITMAGSGEWADSWLLLAHREAPEVDRGSFKLKFEVGSRQWGGMTWDLDLDIGRFDMDTGTHDGEITWDIRRSASRNEQKATAAATRTERLIREILTDEPWTMTRSAIKSLVGGSREVFDTVFDDMAERDVIAHDMIGRTEGGTTRRRMLWGLVANNGGPNRPGSPLVGL